MANDKLMLFIFLVCFVRVSIGQESHFVCNALVLNDSLTKKYDTVAFNIEGDLNNLPFDKEITIRNNFNLNISLFRDSGGVQLKLKDVHFPDHTFNPSLSFDKGIVLDNCNAVSLKWYSDKDQRVVGGKYGNLQLDGNTFVSPNNIVSIEVLEVGSLAISDRSVRDLMLYMVVAKKVSLSNLQVDNSFVFDFLNLPDTIDISNSEFKNPEAKIYLPGISKAYPTSSSMCLLNIYGTDIDKIVMRSYLNYKLYFPEGLEFEFKVDTYQQLLSRFKATGLLDSYERLDKEYIEMKHLHKGNITGQVFNWIDKHWWDYGYNKYLVIRNALIINMIFFSINLFIFRKLLKQGYKLEAFNRINKQIQQRYPNRLLMQSLVSAPYVFIYTCLIFWGLRLDFSRVNVEKFGLFSYVVFQVVAGLVCLAYIANLIVTN